MWFLALGSPGASWFIPLLRKLLEADRATLKLLRHDPFNGEPPLLVRATLYHYRFSSWAERRQTGQWWIRSESGQLVPPLSRPRTAE
jgi:hypothetical protein